MKDQYNSSMPFRIFDQFADDDCPENAKTPICYSNLEDEVTKVCALPFDPAYSDQKVLGEGWFCSVSLVREESNKFALKQSKDEIFQHNYARQLLLQEILNLNNIPKHPNLIGFYGAQVTPNMIRNALEFCPGGSLEGLVETLTAPMSLKQICDIGIQIARGLHTLHTALDYPIVHKDLTLGNVLIGEGNLYKISDFGQSHFVFPDRQWQEPNSEHRINFGTADFTAPEIICGEPYDEKADVYSYACVIICLIQGSLRPFGPGTHEEIIRSIHDGIPPHLPSVSPNCTIEMRNFLGACLEREARQRPNTQQIIAFWSNLQEEHREELLDEGTFLESVS